MVNPVSQSQNSPEFWIILAAKELRRGHLLHTIKIVHSPSLLSKLFNVSRYIPFQANEHYYFVAKLTFELIHIGLYPLWYHKWHIPYAKPSTSALQASTILQRNEQICTGLLSTLLYRNEANVRTYEIRAHWHMIATIWNSHVEITPKYFVKRRNLWI